jgi:hypothetical protein
MGAGHLLGAALARKERDLFQFRNGRIELGPGPTNVKPRSGTLLSRALSDGKC